MLRLPNAGNQLWNERLQHCVQLYGMWLVPPAPGDEMLVKTVEKMRKRELNPKNPPGFPLGMSLQISSEPAEFREDPSDFDCVILRDFM